MNLGLESYVPYVLYCSAIVAVLLSIFWRPIAGIFYLLPLIPLQTLRYRLNDFPLGSSLFGVMLIGIAVGLLRSGRPVFPRTSWTKFLTVFALFTFGSLCQGSLYLDRTMPLPGDQRFGNWQEYMIMPALLLVTAAVVQTKREMLAIVLVICVATLALDKSFWNEISGRDFSSYTEELHGEGGGMGYAGANGLAAFAAQVTTFLASLAAFEKKKSLRAGYYGVAAFSALCLMYSLSRGGYVAFLVGCALVGVLKQRKLLILLVVFLFTWTSMVPSAVQQRVDMTYDKQSGEFDNSTATRLSLWSNAMQVFHDNAMLGSGFDTYEYMHLNKRTDGASGYYADTHNYFVKVFVETGVLGFLLFLWLLGRLLRDGFMLFHSAHDTFFKALGLGLIGWVVCAVVANLFGDRWSFLQVNGYMWVIAGLVWRASEIERDAAEHVEILGASLSDAPPDPSSPHRESADAALAVVLTGTKSDSFRI
ncbi:MAG TPA: O-antigen ligase family protein [Candidatus Sulfotelmatobacter sp.]|nr:O-antigen ligase family protein [Candidatus Sulfotelmatobacter sp.]